MHRDDDAPTMTRNARKHAARKARRDEMLRQTLPSLEDWCTVVEEGELSLKGQVFNDARFPSGCFVTTNTIVFMNHLIAITNSGTKYRLGKPSAAYLDYRKRHNLGPISHQIFRFHPPNCEDPCDVEIQRIL